MLPAPQRKNFSMEEVLFEIQSKTDEPNEAPAKNTHLNKSQQSANENIPGPSGRNIASFYGAYRSKGDFKGLKMYITYII